MSLFRDLQEQQDDYYQEIDFLSVALTFLILVLVMVCGCIIWFACFAYFYKDNSVPNTAATDEEDPPSDYYDDEEDNNGVYYATVYDSSQRSGLQIATEIESQGEGGSPTMEA